MRLTCTRCGRTGQTKTIGADPFCEPDGQGGYDVWAVNGNVVVCPDCLGQEQALEAEGAKTEEKWLDEVDRQAMADARKAGEVKTDRGTATTEQRRQSLPVCKHPPERVYAWRASDGVLCIGCCECGAVLKGAG